MGLFKKLISKAAEAAGLDSISDSIIDNLPVSSSVKDMASELMSNSSAKDAIKNKISSMMDLDEDFDDEEFDEEVFDDDFDDNSEDEEEFDDNFDEDEYDSELEESDEDLEEFGKKVDKIIAEREGNLHYDDRTELAAEAERYGITREEFEKMLDARIDELNDAILAGYDPRYVYRTRSVWRRCPRCGYLNYPNDIYCDWCGYQLRHKAVSALLGALVYMGVSGGNPQKLLSSSIKKTKNKTIKAKKKRTENKAKGIKPIRKASVIAKKGSSSFAAPKKKSFISGSTSSKPEKKKSLFGGSTSSKPEKKKSLFGGSTSSKPEKKKSLFGGSTSSKPEKKKSSLLGGGSSRKSSGIKLGLGKKRR